MRIGTSLVEVGQYNEKVVLNALRRLGPASQRDIAASTQLSVQTVSAIVRHLLSIDVLREIGTDFRGRGRPHVIVDLVPEAAYSIGVHVDPAVTSLVMLDMKGRVVASSDSDEPTLADPVEAMKQTAGRIRELAERTGVPEDRIVGVCMAVPGVVDVANGSLRESVWLPEWQDAPLGALLAEGLGAEKPFRLSKTRFRHRSVNAGCAVAASWIQRWSSYTWVPESDLAWRSMVSRLPERPVTPVKWAQS